MSKIGWKSHKNRGSRPPTARYTFPYSAAISRAPNAVRQDSAKFRHKSHSTNIRLNMLHFGLTIDFVTAVFLISAFTFDADRVYQCRNNIIKHFNIYSQSWNKDLLLSYY